MSRPTKRPIPSASSQLTDCEYASIVNELSRRRFERLRGVGSGRGSGDAAGGFVRPRRVRGKPRDRAFYRGLTTVTLRGMVICL